MNHKLQKSQTTQILYQEPTQEEMHPSFISGAIATLQNISLTAILIATVFSLSIVMLRGCADEVEKQTVMAIKHQSKA